ncbi:DNA replication complex GINS protein [Cyanidiococcus yangmingshanensis]|uniref:DNA replication complex GINS protein n=1 Tax=Cyanidiococcus yangmingshanensis TaxID=2690220 RepID=A0A7J7IP79_9RHOD|nr:DNA replication complex GINS protein [Cyanidiococcus yangmingshanensis]
MHRRRSQRGHRPVVRAATSSALRAWQATVPETPRSGRQELGRSHQMPVLLDRDYYSLDEILETEVRLRCLFRERIRGMAALDASGNAAFAARAEASALGYETGDPSGAWGVASQSSAADDESSTPGLQHRFSEHRPRDRLAKDRADILTAAAAAARNATRHKRNETLHEGTQPVGASPVPGVRDATEALDMLPGVVCDLPTWLAEMLAARMFVRIELPRSLGQRTQRALRADARVVNLAERCPHFYAVVTRCQRFFQMNHSAAPGGLNPGNVVLAELGPILVRAYQIRCLDIVDRAQSTDNSDPLEYTCRLEASERAMFTSIQSAERLHAQWKRGEHRRLRACTPLVPCWHSNIPRTARGTERSFRVDATRGNDQQSRLNWRVPLSARNLEDDLATGPQLPSGYQMSAVDAEKRTVTNAELAAMPVTKAQTEHADKENEEMSPTETPTNVLVTPERTPQEAALAPFAISSDSPGSRPTPAVSSPCMPQTKRRRRMLLVGESQASRCLQEHSQTNRPAEQGT